MIMWKAAAIAVCAIAGSLVSVANAQNFNDPPAPTEGLSPMGPVTGVDQNLRDFVFKAQPSAEHYQIWLWGPNSRPGLFLVDARNSTNPDGSKVCPTPFAGNCTLKGVGDPDILPDGGNYYWWVGTQNRNSAPGTFNWSPVYNFTYNISLDPPVAISLGDLQRPSGSYANAAPPTEFQWSDSKTASWYKLTVRVQDSQIIVLDRWYTRAEANCSPASDVNTLDVCTVTNADYLIPGVTSLDYAWEITPWNAARGSVPATVQRVFTRVGSDLP